MTWLLLFLPFVPIFLFPLQRWHKLLNKIAYISMGYLTYLFVFTLLRDLVWLMSPVYWPNSLVLFLATGVLIAGSFWAAYPRVKKISIPLREEQKNLHGLKIAQISDLHISSTIGAKYVAQIVALVNAQNPHLIVLTGDIGDGPAKLHKLDADPLKNLRSELGVFYVTGNHEYYWNANDWMALFNNLKIIIVNNRAKVVNYQGSKVLVGGVPDPISQIAPNLAGILESVENSDFKILLSHRPNIASEASLAGFDLQLSGHTHGGQFFPWTLVVKFMHKYSRGLSRLKDMWIYVSVGTGSWGPRLRVGTTAEVTLIELKYKQGTFLT